jgi:8-amino-7-oxononanoate synthase
MPRFPDLLAQRLSRLDVSFQRRVLAPRRGIDFASNDYLGFSQDPVFRGRVLDRLRDADVGSSGSRLLRGQSLLFEKVEQNLAEMSGTEAALIFPSGYQANLALLSGLLSSEDYVFSDQLNHASLIDGMRLSRAHRVVYPHRDWVALRRALTEVASQPGLKVIVTESLFGMDGDQAPLASLVDLADEFEALLVVDEAHATGIWGSEGRGGGLVQSHGLSSRVFATVHTGGKALGVGGAWIGLSAELKNYLINFSRPFIFSTAPVPALVISLSESADYWRSCGPSRSVILLKKAHEFRESLKGLQSGQGLNLGSVESSPIVPVLIGENQMALQVATQLQEEGWDVRAIRPPTVPQGTARLRLCIHWDHSADVLRVLSQRVLDAVRSAKRLGRE